MPDYQPAAFKLREDQEIDHPEEIIPTLFSEHADEDAERFGEVEGKAAANESPQPKDEPPKISVESSSQKLQAIFLTDEPLDLVKTIRNVAQLPGLKSCLLSTTEGLKLAGSFGDQSQEKRPLDLVARIIPMDELEIGNAARRNAGNDHVDIRFATVEHLCPGQAVSNGSP